MDNKCHTTSYDGWNYLFILRLQLIHIKKGPYMVSHICSVQHISLPNSSWQVKLTGEQVEFGKFFSTFMCFEKRTKIQCWANQKLWNRYVDGLTQERRNSIANALELCLALIHRCDIHQWTLSSKVCHRASQYWLIVIWTITSVNFSTNMLNW